MHEKLEFDVLFVGGGPANLAAAIHLMDLAQMADEAMEVCLIEKAPGIGLHSLSGAILDPVALKELIPDYIHKGCPIENETTTDAFYYLTPKGHFHLPYLPPYMHHHNCHIISLAKFCRWLGEQAEERGVNLFPGFAGVQVLNEEGSRRIVGVRTGDKGVGRDGDPRPNFEPGVDLLAPVTVFGEGPSGNLLRELGKRIGIFEGKLPQVYETAFKEVIEVPASNRQAADAPAVWHTFGYPLGLKTKGGGFIYRIEQNRLAVGFVLGLDYTDPLLDPHKAFLQFKQHPLIAEKIHGGRILQHGAKTLPAGGYYTCPRMVLDGALIVGDSAALLNIQRLKGIHTAMKSGMLAAETIMAARQAGDYSAKTLGLYQNKIQASWIQKELCAARNFNQALSQKGLKKFFHLGLQHLSGGRGLFDPMPVEKDSHTFNNLKAAWVNPPPPEATPNLDGKLFVDKMTGVYLSGTTHEENQPCHIVIADKGICLTECYQAYRCPCTRFCPAQVYELELDGDGKPELKLNPSNCLHCKTCEIKDPYENITWTPPEGGDGPKYTLL